MNAFTLKLLALALMLLDHIHFYFPDSPDWFHCAGRLAAPIFFFFAAEGYAHTRDIRRYMLRMFIFALVMAAGSELLTFAMPGGTIDNNIFLSLFAALALMAALDWARSSGQTAGGILICGTIMGSMFFVEYGLLAVSMAIVFHLLRGTKAMIPAFILSSLVLSLVPYANVHREEMWTGHYLFVVNPQWMMIFAIPLILAYNGERGPDQPWAKYVFYFFYPLHVWILYAISWLAAA
ncbi:TraX family protein [Paenibacillus thiaminolyticus]|uniref:TraX family protein n=1 Tax=Paenibacillus thiaminolyticus TaxID=49283 RepID=UPI003D2E2D45